MLASEAITKRGWRGGTSRAVDGKTRGRMRSLRHTTLVVPVLTLAMSAALATDNEAQAYKQYGAKNYSKLGTATYYKVAGSSNFYQSTLNVQGPTVRRSSAYGGTQKVVVTRYIWRTNPTNWGELYNTWQLAGKRTTYKYLAPGTQYSFSSWNFDANPFSNYRVVMKVSYYTAGGRFLSSIYTDYQHTGDYQCNTGNCSVIAGRDGRASIMLTY